jgi:putative addiction module killer protein
MLLPNTPLTHCQFVNYSSHRVGIRKTEIFAEWFDRLRDEQAMRRIQVRIDRLQLGNPGPHRPLAGGIVELKIDYGPGYRVYYCHRGALLVILLCGGDKDSQHRDIETARTLAAQLQG